MQENFIRYNKEYFGYIVGFPDGKIILTKDSAKPFLENGSPYKDIEKHKLEQLEVKDGFYLKTPLLVWLEITKKCNLNCPHCYIEGGLERANEMSTEEIFSAIDDMAEMGVWAIAITGGEPTLHKDFVDIVKYARKKNLIVGIATHGLHLTDSLLESLPKDGVIISISLDNLHMVNDDHKTEFQDVAQALLRSRRHGFNANIMTNTNRKNIDDLEHMIAWAENNRVSVRSVPFSPIGSRAKKNASELENIPEDALKAAKFWLKEVVWEHKYHEEVGLCVGVIFNYGLTLAYMTSRCSSARYLAYLASDGTLYPCTMCAGEGIFSGGNVRKTRFKELWRSDWNIRKYSWHDFKDTCSGCPLNDVRYYCSSRCPAMSHARRGNYNSCGASNFEKLSVVIRTSLMESSNINVIEEDLITSPYSNTPLI